MKIKEKYQVDEKVQFKEKSPEENNTQYYDSSRVSEKEYVEEISSKVKYSKKRKRTLTLKTLSYILSSATVLTVFVTNAVTSPKINLVGSSVQPTAISCDIEMDYIDNPNLTIKLENDYYQVEFDVDSFDGESAYYYGDGYAADCSVDNDVVRLYLYYDYLSSDTKYTFKIIDKSQLGGTTVFSQNFRTLVFGPNDLSVSSTSISMYFVIEKKELSDLVLNLEYDDFKDEIVVDDVNNIPTDSIESEMGMAYFNQEKEGFISFSLSYYDLGNDTEYLFSMKSKGEVIYSRTIRTEKETNVTLYQKTGEDDKMFYQITISDYSGIYSKFKVYLQVDENERKELVINNDINDEQFFLTSEYFGTSYFFTIVGIIENDDYEYTIYTNTITMEGN